MSYAIDVLAVGAHPDDVEIFAGGTIARLVELGYRAAIVDLTRGELATHGTPETRAVEAGDAAKVLGLSARENLGLPDGFIDPTSEDQKRACVAAIRRHKPELLLIPWTEDRHPDHAAAGILLQRAVFLAGLRRFEPSIERFVPRQVLHYAMRHRMRPSFIVDTSSAWEKKKEAIRCHRSQIEQPGTLVGSPRALDAIEARDRHYGSMIGASYGEPLAASNTLGLIDPIKHFRDNPFAEAHAFESSK